MISDNLTQKQQILRFEDALALWISKVGLLETRIRKLEDMADRIARLEHDKQIDIEGYEDRIRYVESLVKSICEDNFKRLTTLAEAMNRIPFNETTEICLNIRELTARVKMLQRAVGMLQRAVGQIQYNVDALSVHTGSPSVELGDYEDTF